MFRRGPVPALLAALPLVALLTLYIARERPAFAGTSGGSAPIQVVAAENEYGSIVSQIGGAYVRVTSLLSNPNTDPHEFEASPATARTLSGALLVVKNGIGYDSWMIKLLNASPRRGRVVLSVGELLGHREGDNPHVWYDPNGWTAEAHAIMSDLSRLDPRHRQYYAQRETRYLRSLDPIHRLIATVRRHVHGTAVTATEPVFGYMVAALGMQMRNQDFQKSIMDGTDPSPQAVARFESDLRSHRVRMLFYNRQTTTSVTSRVRALAQQNHIPVVGVTETEPVGMTFQQWQTSQLEALARSFKG